MPDAPACDAETAQTKKTDPSPQTDAVKAKPKPKPRRPEEQLRRAIDELLEVPGEIIDSTR